MAASRNKAPVGSAPWILAERHQAAQFAEQEVEEFSFSVRNEMEWLNEHMAEIFGRPELNITDTFKTPGKLRGKTPRTARKRNPLETRAPLTDIFAPNPANAPSPTRETSFYKQIEQIQIAEDPEDADMAAPIQSIEDADQTSNAIPQGDSGYHGMTEDEMEVDEDESVARLSPRKESSVKPIQSPSPRPQEPLRKSASFLSAKEDFEHQTSSHIEIHEDEGGSAADNQITIHEDEMDLVPTQPDGSQITRENAPSRPSQFSVGNQTASALNSLLDGADNTQDQQDEKEQEQEQEDDDGARTPSDGSSPAKPPLRKISLTFSSLPAREPLAGKKSMGSRVSRTSHLDQYKARSSHFGRFTGGKSLGGGQAIPRADDDDQEVGSSDGEDENAGTHGKTSTQRLHERINMLAKSQEPRTSKSIPGSVSQEPNYPLLPTESDEPTAAHEGLSEPEEPAEAPKAPSPVPNIQDAEDDDDDWIAPVTTKPLPSAPALPAHMKSGSVDIMENVSGKSSIGGLDVEMEEHRPEMQSPARRGLGHLKSASVPNFESPAKSAAKTPESSLKKTISIGDLEQLQDVESSTPAGSPSKMDDEPLSASKTKFFSVLKSAKSIFASSAGVSAQAKLEALSPSSAGLRERHGREQVSTSPRPDLSSIFDKPINPASPARRPATATGTPVRTTRASLERSRREREMEAEMEREEALQNAREEDEEDEEDEEEEEEPMAVRQEKSAKGVPTTRVGAASRAETVSSRDDDYTSADDAPKPGPSRPQRGPPKMREPKSRLLKPTASKESLSKPRHIKVGLGSQRSHPTNADLSKSLRGTLPGVAKTPAARNPVDSANSSFAKTTGPSGAPVTKPTSLALAAKNREREERDAQRKAEKKRAIEQQRAEKAAKAEEERRKADEDRRAEAQKKAAEQQRAQEAKRAASRQALAAEAKKQEQLRAQATSKQTKDLAQALSKEKAATIHGHPRGDLGGARPISRVNTVLNIPPANPAKPPKRFHTDEEPASRPQGQRNAPTFQQLNAKRRKTLSDDEEEEPTDARRSMMAPPIRQSNVRKFYPERERLMSVIDKAKEPNKFAHGYKPAATAGPSSHAQSMFKQTVKTQHQLQHNKHGGHPNDMATISKAKIPFADASGPSAAAGPSSGVFKTPARTTTVRLASPHFPTPELPEIATDSEDDDSDSEAANFQAPSWVNSPALRELLTQQQLVDPMEVFGPIAPLQMEEIFKNKDRHKRFRERTSSAYWAKDKLTEEERKKDMEGREKLMRDGGWTYENTGS
ncbi:inner centromere protein [Diplodia corticola]|uniref:Inner centromere protein n=1 Tax=Diplodia corticola TaxID=236234 RepID=A0A1J9QNZ3_9PEZI|nr:inner centromere protein [Diplodia corticola]OJD29770.1 inner centromere protein [Diplodia corticola]